MVPLGTPRYDPVFKVETVDGRQIWCKRHYRCTPRTVDADLSADRAALAGGEGTSTGGGSGSSAGAWTLTTLDNGVISKESWTTVDAADDLSWGVFYYSGAAAAAGQSYQGALLCSADGAWPEGARTGAEFDRIAAAFSKCGLELWELYGHGPPAAVDELGLAEGRSFMWTSTNDEWKAANPPPLEPIGEKTVQQYRAEEKAKQLAS